MLDELTAADFAAHRNGTFRIVTADGTALRAELTEVAEFPGAPQAARRKPFSLVFRTPPGEPMPQHVYRVEHDQLGALEIFLVPIGADAAGVQYEAVFS